MYLEVADGRLMSRQGAAGSRRATKAMVVIEILTANFKLLLSFVCTMSREASISRKTNETQIEVFIDLDYTPSSNLPQKISISTGIGFLDHVN